jgi:2-polyprenyl-3-methyl-5-hydroxy-6-metoxy-1,4-benzoquinol methylase
MQTVYPARRTQPTSWAWLFRIRKRLALEPAVSSVGCHCSLANNHPNAFCRSHPVSHEPLESVASGDGRGLACSWDKSTLALKALYNYVMDTKTHWENIYSTKARDQVSWYRQHLETSIALIERSVDDRSASIIDVGSGESTLVDDLLARGFQSITVLDVSQVAIEATKKRLGHDAERVRWLVADVTQVELEPKAYDVWHDRAVFHFLTLPEQRSRYVRQVARSVRAGGYVIVSTFGPEGPTKCSGLDVIRYKADALHSEFGSRFRLVESSTELHETPFGTRQQFLYCYCGVE